MRIPRYFPPEGIVLIGHLLALAGGVGFALAGKHAIGGLLVVFGVAGNHIADMVDGTHARATGQCRNGGELLDHFTDPLSFCYWMIGMSVATGLPYVGIICILCIYATAVLTNIRAKITGEFTLAAFGPTEFKTLLALFGAFLFVNSLFGSLSGTAMIGGFLKILAVIGVLQLLVGLRNAVHQVNRSGAKPDTSEWEQR
jgi:phosphatidylglycerophosphate synthase